MIFDFFFGVISFLLAGVAAILPTHVIFPSGLASQIASFMSAVNGWAWLFPVSTLIQILSLIVLIVFVEFLYFTAMYLYSIIHATMRG